MKEEGDFKLTDPDEDFWVGFHLIHVDNDVLHLLLLNNFLKAAESRTRARVIIHKDRIVTSGVWSPEEATNVSLRLRIGMGGYFEDPQLLEGILRPFQYFGLIQ